MNDPKATPGRDATLARAVERVRAQLSHFGKPKEPFGPMLFRQVLARLENEIKRLAAEAARLEAERDAAREACEESVQLQSHYAGLLNQYDGGQRRAFASAEDWMARLRECRAEESR